MNCEIIWGCNQAVSELLPLSMRIDDLHDWNLNPKRAIALQHELTPDLISDVPLALAEITTVAGVDVSIRHQR